jgi:hypothetical protein
MPSLSQGIIRETATIAAAGTTSGIIDINDRTLVGMILPVMTGTSVTFQVSADKTNFYTLHDSTKTAVSVTCDGTARAFYLEPTKFVGWRWLKVVSGSAEASERSITLLAVKTLET